MISGDVRGMGLATGCGAGGRSRIEKPRGPGGATALMEAGSGESDSGWAKAGSTATCYGFPPLMNIGKSDVDTFIERFAASLKKVTEDRMAVR